MSQTKAVSPRPVQGIFGLPLDAVTMSQALALVRGAVAAKRSLFLTTPNLNFLVTCQRDSAFRNSVIDSDLVLADGMPLVWAARLLGLPIRERVAGSALFERLKDSSPDLNVPPMKVYFFGGPAGAAEAAGTALFAKPSGLVCVGFASPGFGSVKAMSSPSIIEHINASGAEFLVVALGAVKGQAWIQLNRNDITVPVISHLGAVVNFTAGSISRAPQWMQRSGLEWLWRIKEEPYLWRRYGADALALGELLYRQVLPCWWHYRVKSVAAKHFEAATVACSSVESGVKVQLSGAWGRSNVHRLHSLLQEIKERPGTVRLDFLNTHSMDAAVFGVLLLLLKQQRAIGYSMIFEQVPVRVKHCFERHGLGYLLECPH